MVAIASLQSSRHWTSRNGCFIHHGWLMLVGWSVPFAVAICIVTTVSITEPLLFHKPGSLSILPIFEIGFEAPWAVGQAVRFLPINCRVKTTRQAQGASQRIMCFVCGQGQRMVNRKSSSPGSQNSVPLMNVQTS